MPWLNGSGSERTAVFRLLPEFGCVGFHHGLIMKKPRWDAPRFNCRPPTVLRSIPYQDMLQGWRALGLRALSLLDRWRRSSIRQLECGRSRGDRS
jgi:hypothetical protein